MNIDSWQDNLADFISSALTQFRSSADEEMERFAVDCHPWNSLIVLAFLTRAELKEAPSLLDPAEMAGWKYYDFGAGLPISPAAAGIGSKMRSAYENTSDGKANVARLFLQRCAAAVASKPVQDALATFTLADGFRITITHPDTDEEFYLR